MEPDKCPAHDTRCTPDLCVLDPRHPDYRPPPNPTDPIYQFFAFAHLPPHLQDVSRPFADLATFIQTLPRNAERTVAMRKLLEAKDAAVRARVAA